MRIWKNNINGFDFHTPSNFTLDLTSHPDSKILYGHSLFEIPNQDIPKTFGQPLACGKPDYDTLLDNGLFIWKNCNNNTWHVSVLAGGDFRNLKGKIRTKNGNIELLNTSNIDASDKLDISNKEINFDIKVWKNSVNSFDFTFTGDTTLDVDTFNLPKGLTLDPDTGEISGTTNGLVNRNVWIQVQDSSSRKIDGKPQTFAIDYDITVKP